MAMPTYRVEVGWRQALAGVFRFEQSRFTNDDGLVPPELGRGDVFSSTFTQFFDGPNDDITADVETVEINRGRDTVLDARNAGTCEINVRRADDFPYWNPANAASPLNADNDPGYKPMRPVRVVATYDDGGGAVEYGMFYGFLRGVNHDPDSGLTELSCVDLFLWLNRMFPISASVLDDGDQEAADVETAAEVATVIVTSTPTITGGSRSGILRVL